MDHLSESTIPALVSSHQSTTAVWQRTAVMIAAWVEILVGVSFLLAPNGQSQFVFGATPEGIGVTWVRFSGVALIGLGISCLPSNLSAMNRNAVRGLFIFNIGATIFFAWAGVATSFRGVMLCPVVMLHAIIAIALALSLRHE